MASLYRARDGDVEPMTRRGLTAGLDGLFAAALAGCSPLALYNAVMLALDGEFLRAACRPRDVPERRRPQA